MVLLDMFAPYILGSKRVGDMSHDTHVAYRVETGDLFTAIAPQTLKSIVQDSLSVDLEDVLSESVEIVQFCLAILPFALERLVLKSSICEGWRARIDANRFVFASSYIAQCTWLLGLILASMAVHLRP